MVVLAVAAMFATSNFLFLWRSRELGVVSTLGSAGVPFFFAHFPYLSGAVALVGLVVLLVVLWKFTSSYRWPLFVFVTFSIVLAFAVGSWTSHVPVHGYLSNRALEKRLPFFERSFAPSIESDRVFKGRILNINGRVFFESPEGPLQLNVPAPTDDLPAPVFIIGERHGATLDVDAIRLLRPKRPFP